MTKIVKQIPNYPDYLISENGDVFSKKRGTISKMKPRLDRVYLQVDLRNNGRRKTEYIHRLVLMTFDRMPKPHEVARHFPDGNPVNNRISNLQWGTHKENSYDRDYIHKTGKVSANWNENNGRCKLSNEQVLEIRELYKTGKFYQRELADKYNVTRGNIGHITRNKTRKLL